MNNTIGTHITLTIFGESHGEMVGCVLDGISAGVYIDESRIKERMNQRKATGILTTSRIEEDEVRIVSGVKDGYTQGSAITILVENKNVRRKDYKQEGFIPRPSHCDYVAYEKYHGYHDLSGGGHFSGRLTAPLVAAGAICEAMLEQKGIYVLTHIKQLAFYKDRKVDLSKFKEERDSLGGFAVLDESIKQQMVECIKQVATRKDSIGASLETIVLNLPVGIGNPFFDTVEGNLAKMMFALPAIKGVEFGLGFDFIHEYGSTCNDAYDLLDGKLVTQTNNNGGILGGITNGMPLVMNTVVKPTPSIGLQQQSVDLTTNKKTILEIKGRHDPCIASRFSVIQSMMTCFVLCDLLQGMYGEGYFGGESC